MIACAVFLLISFALVITALLIPKYGGVHIISKKNMAMAIGTKTEAELSITQTDQTACEPESYEKNMLQEMCHEMRQRKPDTLM